MPLVDFDRLTADQQAVYSMVVAGPRGRFERFSPISAWLANPAFAKHAQAYGAFCRFETTIPRRQVELAILVVAAFWRSSLEWSLHAGPALEEGLSPTTIEAIRTRKPVTLDLEADIIVYRFCTEMLTRRSIPDDVYQRAHVALGAAGVVELVGILGYYSLVAMTTTAFNIPVRDGERDPFSDQPPADATKVPL
jgi:4-carboxymuconolactone decarboxylase